MRPAIRHRLCVEVGEGAGHCTVSSEHVVPDVGEHLALASTRAMCRSAADAAGAAQEHVPRPVGVGPVVRGQGHPPPDQ